MITEFEHITSERITVIHRLKGRSLRGLTILIFFWFVLISGFGQITFTSVQNGNWEAGTTWGNAGNVQGTDWPANGDNAVINHTVTTSAGRTINNIRINLSGVLNTNADIFNIAGNYYNDGLHTSGASSILLTSISADKTIDGIGQISNALQPFCIINASHTILNSANLTFTGNVQFRTNNLTIINNGTVRVNGSILENGVTGCTLTNATNSYLYIGGNIADAVKLNASASGNTVNYYGSSDQIIKTPESIPNSYFNLFVTGSGIKSLSDNITVSQDLDITGVNTTLDCAQFQITGNSAGLLHMSIQSTLGLGSAGSAAPVLFPTNYNRITLDPQSTVKYQSAGNQTISSVPPYVNLTTATSGTKTLGGNINVKGNLQIGSGTVLDVSASNHNITIEGNWINSDPVDGFNEGTGTVTFTGPNAQSISRMGGETFYGLIVNKGGEKVSLSAGNVTVRNLLTLTLGKLDVGTNTIIIPSTGSISGGSSSSYIIAESTGTLKQYLNSPDRLFPVGTTSYYLPVRLNNSGSTSDYYSVNLFPDVTTDGLSGGIQIPAISNAVKVTWRVVEDVSGGTTNLLVTPQWNTNNEGSAFTNANCSVNFHNGTPWVATSPPETASGSNPWTRVSGSITNFSGSGSFGVFSSGCFGDITPPVPSCKNTYSIALGLLTGTQTIVPADIDNGSSDNCGPITFALSKSSFTCTDIGPNNVIMTVADAAGNQSTCTTVVTVTYALEPNPTVFPVTQVVCSGQPTNLLLTSNIPPTTWTWSVAAPAQITGWSDDLSGTKTSIQQTLINSGVIAYKVVYTIIPRIYNSCNLAPITTEVWVEPIPQATIFSSIPTICSGNNVNVNISSPTLTTNLAKLSYIVTVTSDHPGSLGGTASTTPLTLHKADLPFPITGTLTNSGSTPIKVTYTVALKLDGCPDGTSQSVDITVNPLSVTISGCPANIIRPNDAGSCSAVVNWTEPTAVNNCSAPGSLVWTRSGIPPGNVFPVGTATVTYTVTDIVNNVSAVCSFTVTVNDTEKPVLNGCPANISHPNDPGLSTAVVSWPEPTATDNCTAPASLVWTKSHTPGTAFPVGLTTVTYTARDAANNISNICTFTVTVTDGEPPVITCPVSGQQNVTTNNVCRYIHNGTTWDATATDNNTVTSLTYALTGVTSGTGTSLTNVAFNLGVTTVTWTAKDAANNTVTCFYTVSVTDDDSPVIACPVSGQQDVNTNLGCSYVHIGTSWNATATDNCSGSTLTYTLSGVTPGTGTTLNNVAFNPGVTTVTWTARDAVNNTISCSFTVSVTDNEKPVINNCPVNITMPNDAGNCSAVITWTEPTATDNCTATGSLIWTRTGIPPGNVFPVGHTTVTYSVRDAANNVSNVCSFIVTVNDTEKPVIAGCPATITHPNDPGLSTAVVTWPEPTATDNCTAPISLIWTKSGIPPGNVFPAGSTTVTYTVKDAANNVSTVCTFTVTVTDGEFPVITCPVSGQQNVTTNDACTYVHNGTTWNATATDNNAVTSLTYALTGATTGAGTTLNNVAFNLGVTMVIWTARDNANNAVTCNYIVSVTDDDNPVITCPVSGQQDVNTNNGCRYIHSGTSWNATSTDNCSVSTVTYTLTGVTTGSGTTLNNVGFNQGVTTVTWTARDAANNSSISCSYMVSVTDKEKPVINNCPADIIRANDAGNCSAVVSWTEPTATDNCTALGNLVWTKSHIPGSVFQVGQTTVTYTVTDIANNVSDLCSFTVTITDSELPIPRCKNMNIILDLITGTKTITPADIDNGSYDNCGTIHLAIDKSSFSCSDIGPNNVILTVTDAAGNKSTCTSVVTVNYDRPSNPAVSPATSAICNGETTNLLLTNVIPTSWTWTVTAPPQITGWSDDFTGTKSSIQQPLNNSGLIAYRAVYTILPRLYNTCNLAPVTADVWIEPTPQATITSSTPIICNGSTIDVTVNSPTISTTIANLSYVIAVTSTKPGSLGGSASIGLKVFKADLPLFINGTLTNSSDAPIEVTYTVTPKLTFCSDGPSKSVKVTVNPTPRVIPVNSNSKPDSSICYGGSTQIILTSPTIMTSGNILFDYTVSATGGAGVVIGNTAPEVNRPLNYFISFPYQNTSDAMQSVYYSITPKVDNAICAQGNTVVSEIKVHPQTIQYNYPGSDASGILITNPLTCETSTVKAALRVNISNGANPYQISWTGPNNYTNNFDSIEIKNLNQGLYTVRVTDNLGCYNESSKTIVNFTARPQIIPNIKYPNIHVSCPGGNDGSLRVSVLSGVTQPYIFWVMYNDVDILFSGVFPNSIDRDPTAYYDYNGLRAGIYKVVIRDVNGCEVGRTTELKEPAPIIAGFQKSNYNGFNISCIGYSNGSALAVPTGGNGPYSYLWHPEFGVLSVSTTTNLLDSVPAGKYYLLITDQLGCTKTDSVILTEPSGMRLTSSEVSRSHDGNTNISCNGGSDGFIKLTITGGSGIYFYNWTGPNGFTANSKDISGLRAGIYTCIVKDNNECLLISALSFTLTEPTPIAVAGIISTSNDGSYNINCYGGAGSININVSGGSAGAYLFDWSTTNGSGIVTGEEDQNSLTAGTYHLSVTDSNGCIALKDFTLTQPAALVTVLVPTNITCESPGFNNGSVNLTVTGGIAPYTFAWSNGALTEDIAGLTQGLYIITVTDANGCTRTDSIRVNLPPPLTYTRKISDYNGYGISCNGLANGTIQISLTNGSAPFSYAWTGPNGFTATTNDISGLKAGQYSLIITDKNFCTATETISITEPGKFGMTISLSKSLAGEFNINCTGESTGSIHIEPLNPVSAVSYLWADGIFGKTRNNLPAGNYNVIVIDGNNCHTDSVITLKQPDPVKLVLDINKPFCPDKPDGEIKSNVTGGVMGADYSYKWSDNSTGPNLINIPAGFYKVTVNDLNGCTAKDSIKIESLNETCLIIPNAISPNGDLINDVWNIGLIDLYPEVEIKIFNRWGELVWKSEKGYTRKWDGTSNGSSLPIDSYHYVINLHNGSKPIIGNVTIMK